MNTISSEHLNSGLWTVILLSLSGSFLVGVVPFSLIWLHTWMNTIYSAVVGGFVLQGIGLLVMYFIIRPIIAYICDLKSAVRIFSRHYSSSGVDFLKYYFKSSKPFVNNVTVHDEEENGQDLYIEFIGKNSYGVFYGEISDVSKQSPEELSFTDPLDSSKHRYCEVCRKEKEISYHSPIYDHPDKSSAGFYYTCDKCYNSVMDQVQEQVNPEEIVIKQI